MNGDWVATQKACQFYGVSGNTIRRWADDGTIVSKRTPHGARRYLLSKKGILQVEQVECDRECFIYVRVSSNKQREDLDRQEAFLRNLYPDHTVVRDIGSGLNYKRKGLLRLLRLSNKGRVEQIVVFSKDRLCRFGFELLQFQFAENDTELVVHERNDKTPEKEFSEDILAILQVFACRWNGKRKYKINKNQEIQIEAKQLTEEDAGEA